MNSLSRPSGHEENPKAPTLWRAGRVLDRLREHPPGPVHIIDPFKVPLGEAVEKTRELTRLGVAAIILASTDYDSFESHMTPYVEAVKKVAASPVLLHFPPRRGKGFPMVGGADAVLLPALLGSENDYFVWKSLLETMESFPGGTSGEEWPEMLLTVALTFGEDHRTGDLLGTVPVGTVSTEEIDRYIGIARSFGFHLVYLYSRNDRVPPEVVRYFRERLDAGQILFVSGNVRSGRQVAEYLAHGADYVGFAGALERPDWRTTLAEICAGHSTVPAPSGATR
ncbi:hypothetical protein GCM10027160_10450 [Streptomyces calidiresistens]|uniref:Geranylgeranylglyceryl/heptaprenylglyceryl phosphate synthase n=1 Tax=Streptomyces calidiresistens TaxID=1485586 RepID=A0A7W3SZR3_9ACTN|nr:geranylgeranylglyceryl/heptaprenylglyceryl phosphate synthase [Streptomyces calidiresistens]MBB0228227.1 geranylgeranylglyceryl/heptaprenylglyceryl phosphate synthase [Streptomyces calidiresistens]